jgi:hypothetical protein
MKFFYLLFLAILSIFSNLAHARGTSTIADVLKKALPSENLKGYTFSNGDILFYSGGVGSVYESTRGYQEPYKESWEVLGMPGYSAEALTPEQILEIQNGHGYASIIPGGGTNIEVSNTGFNHFGAKVVVPRIAGLINAGANLDAAKISSVVITIDRLIKRKLKDEEYFEYINSLPEHKAVKKIFKNKKLILTTNDYLITGLTTTICHGSAFDVGFKVELAGLEIASGAESAVRAAFGNKDEGEELKTMGDMVAEMHKHVDEKAKSDPGLNPDAVASAHKSLDSYLSKVGSLTPCGSGPGLGIKFQHMSEKCFSVITNDPVVIGRKIVAQRDNGPNFNSSTGRSEPEGTIDSDMQERRGEHWAAANGDETVVPFDWVVVENKETEEESN